MSNMSELWIKIQEMLEDGYSVVSISTRLNVPIEWVCCVESQVASEPTADQYADADAMAYGEH